MVFVAIVVPLASWGLLDRWWNGEEVSDGPLTCTVQCKTFLHEVSQKGAIECASNVEVENEADAIGFHTTTVLEMVPEGTYVEPGDFLMRLDSSPLEELLVQRTIECNERKASLINAEANAETAQIKLEEYTDGLFPQNHQVLVDQVAAAQEEVRQAEQTLHFSEAMYRRGFVTQLAVEADRYSADRARMELKQAETKLAVLKSHSKRKELGTLKANLAVAKANLRYRRHVYDLAVEELAHIEAQIEKCVVTAPAAGNVVHAYYHTRGERYVIEPGTSVREHQLLFRLPNSNEMQVKVSIPEERVAMVKPGQPARVRSDAFPGIELLGVVKKVNEFASPTNHWGPQVKVFDTLVTIDPESVKTHELDLRPGLSAEVFIQVDRREEQLLIPFQAVLKQGKQRFCLTHDRHGFHTHEIQLGETNGKFVIVEEGLEAGDRIVLGAGNYRKEADLPDKKTGARGSGRDKRPGA